MSNVASDLPKGPKGRGLVVFNIQDRIRLRFLHHVPHVSCRAKQLQFALIVPPPIALTQLSEVSPTARLSDSITTTRLAGVNKPPSEILAT